MTNCAESQAGELASRAVEAAGELVAAALEAARHGDPHRYGEMEPMVRSGLLRFEVRIGFASNVESATVRVLAVDGEEPRLEIAQFSVTSTKCN